MGAGFYHHCLDADNNQFHHHPLEEGFYHYYWAYLLLILSGCLTFFASPQW